MSSKETLICFKHCSLSIFCKLVPTLCPVCSLPIHKFTVEPFSIPYPLSNAKENPYSIVIRPSKGNFLDNYKVSDDLHIGITDKNGRVLEYDTCGLVLNDTPRWGNCLAVSLIPESWETFWDQIYSQMLNDPQWSSHNYHEALLNCFNFVLSFLNKLGYSEAKFTSKEDMCEKLILPRLQSVVKYCLIYRGLRSGEFFVQK